MKRRVELLNAFCVVMEENDDYALRRAEMNLLAELVRDVTTEFELQKMCGTVILDGQRDDKEARPLYRCNLQVPTNFSGNNFFKTSDLLAAQAIDEMLQPETENPYRHSFVLNASCLKEAVRSGLYKHDDLRVMVLNANGGRFLCSACLMDGESGKYLPDETVVLLMCLATALERIFPDDELLRSSMHKVFFATTEANAVFTRISPWSLMEAVRENIGHSDDEVNADWRRWYQKDGRFLRSEGLFRS